MPDSVDENDGDEEAEEDELISWPANIIRSSSNQQSQHADPWHRRSSCDHDCILVVEFNEIEGPKTLLSIPTSPGAHFDEQTIAVWLMSCDYGRVHDAETVMRNDEHGCDAFVRHLALFDVEARGFVRPLCIAYISRNGEKVRRLTVHIQQRIDRIVEELLLCNRKQFIGELGATIDTINAIENRAIHTYYELYYQEPPASPLASSRLESISLKARRLYGQLNDAYKSVRKDASGGNRSPCHIHTTDISRWLASLSIDDQRPSSHRSLRPLADLAPCVFADFLQQLVCFWSSIRYWQPSLLIFRASDSAPTIHFGGLPILRAPADDPNVHSCGENADALAQLIADDESDRKSLVPLVGAMHQLMYPLLTGRALVVCGSDVRKSTCEDVVQRLRALQPPPIDDSDRRLVIKRSSTTAAAIFFRQLSSSTGDVDMGASSTASILDLNTNVLHTSEYTGYLLRSFAQKSADQFVSDRALIAYALTIIGGCALPAYVQYCIGRSPSTGHHRKRATKDVHDAAILRNLLRLFDRKSIENDDNDDISSWRYARLKI